MENTESHESNEHGPIENEQNHLENELSNTNNEPNNSPEYHLSENINAGSSSVNIKNNYGRPNADHVATLENANKNLDLLTNSCFTGTIINEFYDWSSDEAKKYCKVNLNDNSKILTSSSADKVRDSTDTKFPLQNSKNSDVTCTEAVMNNLNDGKLNDCIIKVSKPLCADYRSDSESLDSESDSSGSSTESSSSDSEDDDDDDDDDYDDDDEDEDNSECNYKWENSNLDNDWAEKKKSRKKNEKKKCTDLSLSDLPPIEDLKISVPEEACIEIGVITSIVDTLVVVESYKGTAALDIDTVLFLDNGKRPLGKIFDILGPVSEPVYAVRFNSQEQINGNNIQKGSKVYYAPNTQHTSFVFLSEVMKIRGSDASWKDNIEAPSEFQDFSDDEQERLCINKDKRISGFSGSDSNSNEQHISRKRTFNGSGQGSWNISQQNKFRNPDRFPRGKFSIQSPRFSPIVQYRSVRNPTLIARPQNIHSTSITNHSPYPGGSVTLPPLMHFTPRFSGPPFPTFGPFTYGQGFPRPFYQQRMHSPPGTYGTVGMGPLMMPLPPPPPPPLPSAEINEEKSSG